VSHKNVLTVDYLTKVGQGADGQNFLILQASVKNHHSLAMITNAGQTMAKISDNRATGAEVIEG